MTRWRGPYLSARIIPLTVSLAIGLVTNALLPGFAVGWLGGGTVAILLRLRCGWWRAGARRPTPDEVAILRSTSGLIPALRGRGEPTWWIRPTSACPVWMPNPRNVVVTQKLIDEMRHGAVHDESGALLLAAAVGRLPVTCSPMVGVVEFVSLPARVLARVVPRSIRRPWHPYLVVLAVLSLVAVVQHAGAGRWGLIIGQMLLAGALVLAPWWEERWQAALRQLDADGATEAGLQTLAASPT